MFSQTKKSRFRISLARGEAESGQTLAAYRSTRARHHLTKSTAADTRTRDINKHMNTFK